tara:strand:+ start:123 stop:431 length:309 start_codon:yes stop_codon:yes gene_type:complete
MAHRLEKSEVAALYPKNARWTNVRDKYPWNDWTDGAYWLVKRGVDYTVTDKTFENTVYRLKSHLGRIKLHKVEEGYVLIALQVLPKKPVLTVVEYDEDGIPQ